MKLCYVLPQYHKNSAENFFHIANFLSELGKKVELFVIIEHSDVEPNINNIEGIFVLSPELGAFSRFIKLIKIYFKLYKKGVHIFFARSSLTGVIPLVFANKILNFNKANVIFWSCGQDVVPLSFSPTKRNLKRLISKILAWFAFKYINYLATGPELMVNYYQKQYSIPVHKILTLYNDISLNRFYPLSDQEKKIIKEEILGTNKKVMLFVHTFNESRGADLLPIIAKNIYEKELNVIILAIGRQGDYSNELNKKIIEFNLENYLFNLGEVANKDIAKYYQISDLFLMPSRGEGFPRVLLEAMASGCPAIAFNVGGVSEILPEDNVNHFIINLDNEERFIDQSIKLINESTLLEKQSKKSYEKAKIYSTENIVDMYVNCLSEI